MNINGIGSLFRFSPVRGRISLVTRLACTVLARLKSERFAIFGHVRQTDSQCQFCAQRHVARPYTGVYRAPPFSVVHAHLGPKLSRDGPECERDSRHSRPNLFKDSRATANAPNALPAPSVPFVRETRWIFYCATWQIAPGLGQNREKWSK